MTLTASGRMLQMVVVSHERLRAERDLLRAEVRAWRRWEHGTVPDPYDMVWAGGDEWGEALRARAATDAFDKEG